MPQISTLLPGLRYQKYWQEHFSDVGLGVTGLQAETIKTDFRHIATKALITVTVYLIPNYTISVSWLESVGLSATQIG